MEKEIVYNKLVRDNILNVIEKTGKKYTYHIADENEYKSELLKKVTEELKEFEENPSEEEMADIYEVLEAISAAYNLDIEKIQKEKEEKALIRGEFNNKIILEKVIEE